MGESRRRYQVTVHGKSWQRWEIWEPSCQQGLVLASPQDFWASYDTSSRKLSWVTLISALRHCLIYNSLKPNLLLPQLPGTSRQAKVSAGPARSGVVQPHRCPLPPGSACPMACPGTSYASACLRSLHELFPLPETCFLHPTNTCFSSEFQLCVTSPRALLHSHQANVSTGNYS